MENWKEWAALIIAGLGMDFLALKSGLMGSFMALAYEKKQTARRAAMSIVSGAILAGYLGPIAAGIFGMDGPGYAGACFLVGLLSMRLVPMILEGAQDVARNRLQALKNGKNGKPDGNN
jgi:hypothetical protein